ncbi:hypothetical protein BG842_01080 [Haladaptatus sp. W1]|uniref:DUF6517 family protein n=1 Tax=Haladaptatus sp. W1 TaxID=1897478 RepID=UPI000849966A|nr:DUF6517 family protein [Haladaptatus sp. W1]ODR82339.1 hypothetical protein BG842_01080 [Haladaptatus sp. W1]
MNRKLIAGALLATLVLTSGCLGFILGDTLEVSATKATVGDNALSQTGYEKAKVESLEAKRTFEAAGQSREVKVTNWVAQYEKTIGIDGVAEGTAATFVVVSSPDVKIASKSFNPLSKFDNRDLVEKFVSGYGNIHDIRTVGSENVTVLGTNTKVSEFTATASSHGANVDVTIQATKLKHDGDYIVVLAVYPKRLDESDSVSSLLSGIQHGG